MTNEEKAEKIADSKYLYVNGRDNCEHYDCYLSATEMAKWKDEQFKEQRRIIRKHWQEWAEEQKQQLIEKACEWLKKQGEQSDFNVKDYNSIDPHFGKDVDKIELKFKTGDYVVYLNDTYMLEDDGKHYILTAIKEKTSTPVVHLPYGNEDYTMHKWDITDVKDGDIVVDKSDGSIGIFQSIGHHPDGGSYNDTSYCCLHCRCDDEFFYADFENGNTIDSDDLTPATKEERDTLFTRMKEAGYEWNEEKLKLEKT